MKVGDFQGSLLQRGKGSAYIRETRFFEEYVT